MVCWWLLLRKRYSWALFDGKQCREQFVTPLSCFPQSRCNSLTFQIPVLPPLLLDLDTCGGVDPLGVFPLFIKMVANIIALLFLLLPRSLCSRVFVLQKLSIFCEKYVFLPDARYAYKKGLGCTDALQTTSHHIQKSSDTAMESYIVQLVFSAAFNRVSHSCLLFKLSVLM